MAGWDQAALALGPDQRNRPDRRPTSAERATAERTWRIQWLRHDPGGVTLSPLPTRHHSRTETFQRAPKETWYGEPQGPTEFRQRSASLEIAETEGGNIPDPPDRSGSASV